MVGSFFYFWLIFLPLSIRCGPCRDLIFCRNFVKTYAVHQVKSVEIFKIISCIGKPLENTLSAKSSIPKYLCICNVSRL